MTHQRYFDMPDGVQELRLPTPVAHVEDETPPEEKKRRQIDDRFREWTAKNPRVVEAFLNIAERLVDNGEQRISARDIFGDMRRNAELLTLGDEYKINNDFAAPMARLAEERCPLLCGKFEFRKRTSQK